MSNLAAPFVFDSNSRRFYHGTGADLKPGDLLQGGYSSNYTERRSPWIYFSETLHAATWGAELAKGEGPGRIYVVEPTGPFMDDPNVTDHGSGNGGESNFACYVDGTEWHCGTAAGGVKDGAKKTIPVNR